MKGMKGIKENLRKPSRHAIHLARWDHIERDEKDKRKLYLPRS